MTSKVFVTQVPNRRDPLTQALAPSVNITPAGEYGEIIVMMPSKTTFHDTHSLVNQLRVHLNDYDFKSGDCLLGLGDPCVVASAVAILADEFGTFRLLKWERNLGRYLPYIISVE